MATCYDCRHARVCRFKRDVQRSIHDNLDMVDADQPSTSPTSWITMFIALAEVCTEYDEATAMDKVE